MNDRNLIVEYVAKANPRTEPRLKRLKNGLKLTVELTEQQLTELVMQGLDRQAETQPQAGGTETKRPTPRRQ